MSVVPEDTAHPIGRQLTPSGVNAPQGDGNCIHSDICSNLKEVPVLTTADVELIKSEVRFELTGEQPFDGTLGDSAGALLRIIFHDSASYDKNNAASLSGLNGCVNQFNSGNFGLENVQRYLSELQALLFADHGIQIVSTREDSVPSSSFLPL